MTFLKTAAGLIFERWTSLSLLLAVPHVAADGTEERLDPLEAEERQLRVLMSHWF